MAVASSSLIPLQHVPSDGFTISAPPLRLLRPHSFAMHRTCIFSLPSASFRPSSPSLSVYAFQPVDSQEGKTKGANLLHQSEYLHTSVSTNPFLDCQIYDVIQGKWNKNTRQSPAENWFSDSKDSNSVRLIHSSLRSIIISLGILSISTGLFCGCAQASEATIKASHLGLKIASILRKTGWPDEAIVFFMAMLPILELRGAIPVGYWMQLDPLKLSVLSILGNMVPVPFVVLYMAKLANFLSSRSSTAKKIVDMIFESTRRKAGPIQEFKWLGLMLFVAVPFPGTGAWTGAMASSVLGMNFWDAISANFLGVIMAGILVNLLVNLGFKYALVVGVGLFLGSTFMWSFLRVIMIKKPELDADN